jgi:hypothetical protein
MDLGWFTFTSGVNTFAMIFWPLALIALAYLGWFRNRQAVAMTPAVRNKRTVTT